MLLTPIFNVDQCEIQYTFSVVAKRMNGHTGRREAQAQACLERLIRLDCRDSNFNYRDPFRKYSASGITPVYYPHTPTELASGDHLLRHFWRHIETYYFNKIEQDGLFRLNYIRSLFSNQVQQELGYFRKQCDIELPKGFLEELRGLFSEQHCEEWFQNKKMGIDTQNWVKTLYVIWQMAQNMGSTSKKQIKFKFSKIKECKQIISNHQNQKNLRAQLRKEGQILNQLISQRTQQGESDDEISQLISELENELEQNCKNTFKYSQQLYRNVLEELKETEQRENLDKINCIKSRRGTVSMPNLASGLLKNHLDAIQFLIQSLQLKQTAESMSKLLAAEKVGNEIRFLVSFQKALNLEHKWISEKEFLKLNGSREYSMTHFFRTANKTHYSFLCNNYLGFREVYANRGNLAKFRNKDIFPLIKKSPHSQQSHDEAMKIFQKFQMCHHCKCIFLDYMLVTCKFKSDRQSMPRSLTENISAPEFAQIHAEDTQRSRVSKRFMTRRKNCINGYAKINDEFVCLRKYCLGCLRDNYASEKMREIGICPFCQGACVCSRCLRNQKITKLKSIYSILGGDMNKIIEPNNVQQLELKEDNEARSRGRPRKITRPLGHISTQITMKKMRAGMPIAQQMEFLMRKRGLKRKRPRLQLKKTVQKQPEPVKRGRGRPPKLRSFSKY